MEHRASRVERDGVAYRVEGRPLPPLAFHGGFRETRLARPGADVRAVVPAVQGWALGLLFLLMAAGAARVAWDVHQAGNPGVLPAAIGVLGGASAVVGLVAGLNLLTDRTRFDRATGRASRRRLGRAVWAVGLSDVLAVQCLYTGRRRTKSGWVRQYQINLVLRAEDDRRVQVCGDSHPDWVRALGRDLAEFLGVPVIDQTPPPGPGPVGAEG